MTRTTVRFSLLAFVFGLVLVAFSSAQAYQRYKADPSQDPPASGNCSTCHGNFTDATSPKGTVFPSDNKHVMHNGSQLMNTECNLCHTSGDNRNPFIGSSDGTNDNTGRGCVGCHGREEDAGNDFTSPGRGAGLRQHHFVAGTELCAGCHTDANPASYTPVGEDVMPQYYGTVDTNADDPCNPLAQADVNENWSDDTDYIGLDNDGDDLYDTDDVIDCPEPGAMLLTAVGAMVLGGLSRRRKQ